MKYIFYLLAISLVAVTALPDGLIKLDPGTIVKAMEEVVQHTTTEAAAVPEAIEAEKEKETVSSTPKKTYGSGTVADRENLVAHLFHDYKKVVNPDKPDVRFGLSLINFHVCDYKQILESNVWLKMVWQDSRLAWDEKEYGGVEVLRYDSKELWKPDVTLYNSADPVNQMSCWDSQVLIYSTGEVLWVPPCKLISRCHYTLKKEPYGEQTCTLKFGSWTFDGLVMDLEFYKDKKEIDLEDLTNTSGFEVVTTTGEKHTRFYPCCAEPYQDLTFNMTVKRVPGEELVKRF